MNLLYLDIYAESFAPRVRRVDVLRRGWHPPGSPLKFRKGPPEGLAGRPTPVHVFKVLFEVPPPKGGDFLLFFPPNLGVVSRARNNFLCFSWSCQKGQHVSPGAVFSPLLSPAFLSRGEIGKLPDEPDAGQADSFFSHISVKIPG